MIRRLRELPGHWLEIGGATVFWCLLWGAATPLIVIGGILVAAGVMLAFPLPRASHELTLRPIPFVILVVRFAADMVRSALEVAWYALRPGPPPPSSIVAVPLASHSDLFLTATAMLTTLIPGSVVVEAQRATGTLFMHVIGAGTAAQVERARQRTLDQEMRLLRAFARRPQLDQALETQRSRRDAQSETGGAR